MTRQRRAKPAAGRWKDLLRLSGRVHSRWYFWMAMSVFSAYVTVDFAINEAGGGYVPGAVTLGCLLLALILFLRSRPANRR